MNFSLRVWIMNRVSVVGFSEIFGLSMGSIFTRLNLDT